MQKFFVALLLSISAAPRIDAAMWFPPQNSFTAVSKISSGYLTASTAHFTLDVGDKIFVHVAKDNLASSDGETNEIVAVEDSLGNTYVKIIEYTNGQGKKLAGVTAAMFMATNTGAYPTVPSEPFTVTIQFSTNNVAAKAMAVQRVVTENSLIPVSAAVLANDNANPSLIDLEVPPDTEHLWVRTMGLEGAWVNFFETPTYDDWGTAGTYGGGGASNVAVAFEADISAEASNPSDPIAINADSVSILVVFREDVQ